MDVWMDISLGGWCFCGCMYMLVGVWRLGGCLNGCVVRRLVGGWIYGLICR